MTVTGDGGTRGEPPRGLGRPGRRGPRRHVPDRGARARGGRADVDPQPRRAASRSSSAARATRVRRSASPGRCAAATTGSRRSTGPSPPASTFGMTPRDLMLAQYAKASDAGSGGRQMPGHYGSPGAQHRQSVSSPVATQILHAVGIALAARIRGHGPGRRRDHGRGELQPGRRPRGAQLRRDPPAAVRVHRGEQRLRDQRPLRARALRAGRGDPCGRVRDPGGRGGRDGRARLLPGRAARRSTGRAPAVGPP